MNAQHDVLINQAQLFIHVKLESDAAYQWSLENNDIRNMQMVLRAHGYDFDADSAAKQIQVAMSF